MKSWNPTVRALAIATGLAIAFGACDEKLDSGLACPALCPQPGVDVRDTTLFAIAFDTSIAGYPAIGEEKQILIATLGDTLETRGIIRFDSLPTTFRHANSATDSAIFVVDTGSYVRFLITTDTSVTEPTTVSMYDVDLGDAEEVDPTAVNGAFTPDRLLGSRTIPADSLADSVVVRIDPEKLLARIQAPEPRNRLRVGVRVTSPSGSAHVSMISVDGGGSTQLVFRPSTDPDVAIVFKEPQSETSEELFISNALRDYMVVADSPPDPAADILRVGGLPGRRAYMRFEIPQTIFDSGSVIRATLLLGQSPAPLSPSPDDTLSIFVVPITASNAVTDLRRVLLFPLQVPICPVEPLRLVPSDTGEVSAEVINVVRCWGFTNAETTPRALGFFSDVEGITGSFTDIFSTEAPDDVRPRLHLTYVPRRTATIP